MRNITPNELKKILDDHKLWLKSYMSEGKQADLSGADLSGADLSGADLSGADLSGAYLSGADLSGAYLSRANLSRADLSGADLSRADNAPHVPLACPSDGAFIGWKKCNGYILKLEIPAEAKRSSATTNKCRAEFVKVLEIQNNDGTKAEVEEVSSSAYAPIKYKVGDTVYPDSFDENRFKECSHGIHFFVDRQSAVDW